MEAKVVPSGEAEVAKLQANEKFVYLRPWWALRSSIVPTDFFEENPW